MKQAETVIFFPPENSQKGDEVHLFAVLALVKFMDSIIHFIFPLLPCLENFLNGLSALAYSSFTGAARLKVLHPGGKM